jgi:hypothetical protein
MIMWLKQRALKMPEIQLQPLQAKTIDQFLAAAGEAIDAC